jgi:hypothetical protein
LTGLHTLQLILDKSIPPSYKLHMAFLLNKLLTLLTLRTSHTALTWIHSHQQHTLNDAVDVYAKKATQLAQPPAPLQTSPIAILADSFPIEGKPHLDLFQRLIPHRTNSSISSALSYQWWKKSPLSSLLPFKWSTGQFTVRGFAFPHQKSPFLCTLCQHTHPLTFLACLSLCTTFSSALRILQETWPPPVRHIILQWYATANDEEKLAFVSTLLPLGLVGSLRRANLNSPTIKKLVHQRNQNLMPAIIKLLNALPPARPCLPSRFPATSQQTQQVQEQKRPLSPDDVESHPKKRCTRTRNLHRKRKHEPPQPSSIKKPRLLDALPP